jgi:hypothetical protein
MSIFSTSLRVPTFLSRQGSCLKTAAVSVSRFNAIAHSPLRVATPLMSCHSRSVSHSQQPWFTRSLTKAFSTDSSSLKANPPVSNTLFVANLPWSADEPEIEALFTSYGEVKRVSIGRDPSGRARGFCHIEFHTTEASEKAMAAHANEPFSMGPRMLRLDYATVFKRDSEVKKSSPPVVPGPTLYIDKFYGKERDLELLLGEHVEGVRDLYFSEL